MIENMKNRGPRIILIESMVFGTEHVITRMESDGQRQLVQSEVLPTDVSPKCKASLEAAGVKFGEPVNGDPIFLNVTLPAGWKKERTDHSVHSDLLDEQGRKRAGIFYKAAFYDRSAQMHAVSRYGYSYDYERDDGTATVTDGGKEIYRTEKAEGKERYDRMDAAGKLAAAWLNANYPKWKDADAYWNDNPSESLSDT